MKKKVIHLFAVTLVAAIFASCSPKESSPSTVAPSLDESSSSTQQESQNEDTSEIGNESVTEFTVEILPAVESMQPVDDPYLSFTLMHIPNEWVEENMDVGDWHSYQYVYNHQDGSIAAIIQGSREVFDPENPYADVWEEYNSTVSIEEIDISEYPVMLHIMESTDPEDYTYCYYVNAGGKLVQFEFYTSDKTPQTREQFDAIIASFKIA